MRLLFLRISASAASSIFGNMIDITWCCLCPCCPQSFSRLALLFDASPAQKKNTLTHLSTAGRNKLSKIILDSSFMCIRICRYEMNSYNNESDNLSRGSGQRWMPTTQQPLLLLTMLPWMMMANIIMSLNNNNRPGAIARLEWRLARWMGTVWLPTSCILPLWRHWMSWMRLRKNNRTLDLLSHGRPVSISIGPALITDMWTRPAWATTSGSSRTRISTTDWPGGCWVMRGHTILSMVFADSASWKNILYFMATKQLWTNGRKSMDGAITNRNIFWRILCESFKSLCSKCLFFLDVWNDFISFSQ